MICVLKWESWFEVKATNSLFRFIVPSSCVGSIMAHVVNVNIELQNIVCKLQGYVHNMAQSTKHRQQLTRNKQETERPARKTPATC
jgi:hypothetical protein